MSQYAGMKQVNFHEGATGSFLFNPSFNFTVRRSASLSVEVTPGEGMGWHVINEKCRLLDLLSDEAIREHIQDKTNGTQGILYIGDSIANFESLGLCELLHLKAGSDKNPSQVKNWFPGNWSGNELGMARDRYFHHYGSDLNHCETPGGLKVANMFLVGLNEDPPWWMSQSGGPSIRVKEAARLWKEGISRDAKNNLFTIPGAPFPPPSMVIFNSAIWDQSGAFMRHEFLNVSSRIIPVLPGEWLEEWAQNFTKAIEHVRMHFNQSLIIYKTTTPPMPVHREMKVNGHHHGLIHPQAGEGEVHFDEAGYDALVSLTATKQINQMGRMVAQQEGLFILDTAAMSDWLTPRVYLRDGHHPSSLLVHDTNNLALNMLKDWLDSKREPLN